MSEIKILRADLEGKLGGVQVIAVHGYLHPTESPARCGPVYADHAHSLLRFVEKRPVQGGIDVVVEIAHPPLPETGDLPGHGTRIGPWPARLDNHVVMLGPAELKHVDELKPPARGKEPPTVERFVRWLRTDRTKNDELQCEEVQGAALWYCSALESAAVFDRIHAVVQDELFRAARAAKAGAPGSRVLLENASWWLSRASRTDADIYRAAAGLRRAASNHWRLMLREGLRKPKEEDWQVGLQDADRLLDNPPAPETSAAGERPKLTSARDALRRQQTNASATSGKKGSAAA